jgi:hypothetical protein
MLGLPAAWEEIEDWLNDSRDVPESVEICPPVFELKNPEITILDN